MSGVVGTLLKGQCPRMPWYTDLQVVFQALGGREREFDWLVTELDCNRIPPELQGDQESRFFDGTQLSDLVHRQAPPVQFIWAVLTGFDRGTSIDITNLKVVPRADGNPVLWEGEPRIQYPGARVELVCWDSGSTLLITSDTNLTERFRGGFPGAVDLAEFNKKRNDAG